MVAPPKKKPKKKRSKTLIDRRIMSSKKDANCTHSKAREEGQTKKALQKNQKREGIRGKRALQSALKRKRLRRRGLRFGKEIYFGENQVKDPRKGTKGEG